MIAKMNLLATHISVLLCLSLGVRSQWSPAVQKVLDKSPISNEDLEQMLKEERYSKVSNCGNDFGKNSSDVLSPSKECDQAGMGDLKEGIDNYTAFNVKVYMDGFWNSTVGGKFLEYFKGRNVSDEDLRRAMDEFWFTEDNGTAAFKSVFFDSEQIENHHRYNNWYTYDIAVKTKKLNCTAKKSKQSYSAAVQIFCPGVNPYTNSRGKKTQAAYASFAYPSHPYDDMISYTLCAWKNSTGLSSTLEECERATGGEKIVDIKLIKTACSNGEYLCLKSVFLH